MDFVGTGYYRVFHTDSDSTDEGFACWSKCDLNSWTDSWIGCPFVSGNFGFYGLLLNFMDMLGQSIISDREF